MEGRNYITMEMIPWEVKNKPRLEDWLYNEGR